MYKSIVQSIILGGEMLLLIGCGSMGTLSPSPETERPNVFARECVLPDGFTCPLPLPAPKGTHCTCTRFSGGLDPQLPIETSGFAR